MQTLGQSLPCRLDELRVDEVHAGRNLILDQSQITTAASGMWALSIYGQPSPMPCNPQTQTQNIQAKLAQGSDRLHMLGRTSRSRGSIRGCCSCCRSRCPSCSNQGLCSLGRIVVLHCLHVHVLSKWCMVSLHLSHTPSMLSAEKAGGRAECLACHARSASLKGLCCSLLLAPCHDPIGVAC